MFKMGDLVTLDDNKEYVVADVLEYNSKKYLCMGETENPKNVIFSSYEEKGEDVFFDEVEDPEVLFELMRIVHDKVFKPIEEK